MLTTYQARVEDARALAGAVAFGSVLGLLIGGSYLGGANARQAVASHVGAPRIAVASSPAALRPRDLGLHSDARVDEDAPLRVGLVSELPVAAVSPAHSSAQDLANTLRDRFRFAFAIDRPIAQPYRAVNRAGSEGEADCLAQAVYYEARGESTSGQAAVAQVVLNRVRHPAFPKTVCGVVYQRSGQGCQFSFACDGSTRRGVEPGAWRRAQGIAERALNGAVMADIGQATLFHAARTDGGWASGLLKVAQIGAHVFYRISGRNGPGDLFRSHDRASAAPTGPISITVATIASSPEPPKLFASPQLVAVSSPDALLLKSQSLAGSEAPLALKTSASSSVVDQSSQKPLLTASAGL